MAQQKRGASRTLASRTLVGTLVKAGRYEEAIAKGEEDIRAGAGSVEVRHGLAEAYARVGNAHRAAQLLDEIPLEEGPVELLDLRVRVLKSLARPLPFLLRGMLEVRLPDHPVLVQELAHRPEPEARSEPMVLQHGQPETAPVRGPESPTVEFFREEAVALEENPLTSAPVQSFDDMVIEAAAEEDDDDPTEETFIVSQARGIGGVGLKLFPRQPSYQDEDDEVVVIERETGTQRTKGSHLWFRGGEPRSWAASATRTYGFEDDDKATEVVQRNGDGFSSRTRLQETRDEEEVVHTAQQTGSNRYKPYIPAAAAGLAHDRPVSPPPSNLLNEIEKALAAQESAASAAGSVEHRDEDALELEEMEDAPRRPVRGTGEGPVARLATTPAVPLRPSVAPPFTRPPVPPLPSQYGRDNQPPPAAPTPSLPNIENSELDAPAMLHVLPPQAEALARAHTQGAAGQTGPVGARSTQAPHLETGAEAAPQYFRRPAKLQEQSRAPLVLTGLITGALLLGGYVVINNRESHQVANLQDGVLSALSRGSHAGMLVALSELQSGPKESDDVQTLSEALTWMLWAQEGIKLGDTGPDPKPLESVQPLGPLPLVVARAERDLLRGDVLAGAQRVKESQVGHEEEPVLSYLLGRFALARVAAGVGGADEADGYLKKALGLLETDAHPAFPVAKVTVLAALARLQQLQSTSPATAELWKPVLNADGSYVWAQLEQGVAAIPADMPVADADKALKALQVSLRDKLSPRQQSWIAVQRARRALTAGNLDGGTMLLQEAARVDGSWPEPLVALGQLKLDQGQIKAALEKLEKAYAIAPLSLSVIPVYVSALIEDTRLASARDIVSTLPEGYQELGAIRLIKARLAREVGDFNGASAQVSAGLKLLPEDFDLQLEQSQILFAQKRSEASSLIDALLKSADEARRPSVLPWLKAQQAALSSSGSQAKGLAASAEQSARSLLVLADDAMARGDATGAETLLMKARSAGDLPQVVLTLARLQGVVPEKREGARADLQQLVQGRCGDSPVCQDGARLLEQLH